MLNFYLKPWTTWEVTRIFNLYALQEFSFFYFVHHNSLMSQIISYFSLFRFSQPIIQAAGVKLMKTIVNMCKAFHKEDIRKSLLLFFSPLFIEAVVCGERERSGVGREISILW